MFNRYVSKTLLSTNLKSSAKLMSRYNPNVYSAFSMMLHTSSIRNNKVRSQFISYNKRNFFDYDNRDKNIFSSDDEEPMRSSGNFDKGSSQFSNSFDDGNDMNMLKRQVEAHEGKFEVEEIPLYISKLRNELKALKTLKPDQRRRSQQIKNSYFRNIRGISAMFYQNKDEILSDYPKFSTVLYEFLAYHDYRQFNQTLDILEDHIWEANIANMPIAGIKNFIVAMRILGRGRREIIDKTISVLKMRTVYNDVSNNQIILRALIQLRALEEEYLLETFKGIQNEISIKIADGTADLSSARITNRSFLRQSLDPAIKYLADSDLTITSEDVKGFLERHQVVETNGVNFVQMNEKTDGIKDHILLILYQYVLLEHENNIFYEILLLLKYLSGEGWKDKAIIEELPMLKDMAETNFQKFRDNIKPGQKRWIGNQQNRIASCLKELGIPFKVNERCCDFYIADFVLSNEKTIIEYGKGDYYIKTADTKNDKLVSGINTFRKTIFENEGYKVVIIDYFDFIERESNHLEMIKLVKEKLGIES